MEILKQMNSYELTRNSVLDTDVLPRIYNKRDIRKECKPLFKRMKQLDDISETRQLTDKEFDEYLCLLPYHVFYLKLLDGLETD
jgi:chemotaxis protein CheY-P-specific phosphatase CheC